MTTVVAAFCPWTGQSTVLGVALVGDCRSSVELVPGLWQTYSDETEKIFRLGRYIMAAYSGNSRSAHFALRRLLDVVPKKSPLPAGKATEQFLRATLHKGAMQAQHVGSSAERAQSGGFQVFVAFMDSAWDVSTMLHTEPPGAKNRVSGWRPSLDHIDTIQMMGSGAVAIVDFVSSLSRIVGDDAIEENPLYAQGGLLSLALLDLLEVRTDLQSGGGIQSMTLSRDGVQPWSLWSSVPEYLTDPTVDPQWIRHGPAAFKA